MIGYDKKSCYCPILLNSHTVLNFLYALPGKCVKKTETNRFTRNSCWICMFTVQLRRNISHRRDAQVTVTRNKSRRIAVHYHWNRPADLVGRQNSPLMATDTRQTSRTVVRTVVRQAWAVWSFAVANICVCLVARARDNILISVRTWTCTWIFNTDDAHIGIFN